MDVVKISTVETPFGGFYLATRGSSVIQTHGPAPGAGDAIGWAAWQWQDVEPAGRDHAEAHAQIRSYFAGKLRAFALPLALDGSEIHRAAWAAALRIPYGETMTYGEIAWEIGAPGAARLAGRAMAICPAPLLVPLHRVVGAHGRRCGDLDGWTRRMQLLTFERENCESPTRERAHPSARSAGARAEGASRRRARRVGLH